MSNTRSKSLQILGLRQIIEAAQLEQLQKTRRCSVSHLASIGIPPMDDRHQAAPYQLPEHRTAVVAAQRIDLLFCRRLAVGDQSQHVDHRGRQAGGTLPAVQHLQHRPEARPQPEDVTVRLRLDHVWTTLSTILRVEGGDSLVELGPAEATDRFAGAGCC